MYRAIDPVVLARENNTNLARMTSEFAERFRQKCFSKFGIQMEVAECLRALTMAFELHKANISACENRSGK